MTHVAEHNEEEKKSLNFIEMAVEADLAAGKNGGRLNTRFPPEPNGYFAYRSCKGIFAWILELPQNMEGHVFAF